MDDRTTSSPGSRPAAFPEQPLFWLAAAVAGLLIMSGGTIAEVYRHEHGAEPAALLSADSPGTIFIALGFAMTAIGVLAAMSLIVLRAANSRAQAMRLGALVVVAWVSVVTLGVAAATYAGTSELALSHAGHGVVATPTTTATPAPAARLQLSGEMLLDGIPVEAEFSGVRIERDGLVAACQRVVAPVITGRYETHVLTDHDVVGCGAPGATMILWIYKADRSYFSTETQAWQAAPSATFDATFSTANPAGAALPVTDIFGNVTRNGVVPPAGTLIEAYAGDTLCARTSFRQQGEDYEGYALFVSGPDLIDGCDEGATLTFRVGGDRANETATNDLGKGDAQEVNLTVP